MTPRRKRMLDAMILRGFARHTQETYLGAVIRLSQHYNCSGDPAMSRFKRICCIFCRSASEPAPPST